MPRKAATADDALAAWRAYLGLDAPLLLVRNSDRARKALMRALRVAGREPVGVPVNTRRPLSEAVKRSGGTPLFVELDECLEFDPRSPGLTGARIVWAQPVGGMAPPEAPPGAIMLVDFGFTLPAPLAGGEATLGGAATLWGLHLGGDEDGALVAFANQALYDATLAALGDDDRLGDVAGALAQCRRLAGPDGLAARQLRVLDRATSGLEAGAGLPVAPDLGSSALPFGLAVRVPDEADLATFISYVRNEHCELDWLPELQPMFYVAFQQTRHRARTRRSGENLARWVVAPLGPDFVDDEIVHAVLGLLKAAEYTGVRWRMDPARARWYGDLMFEWYGPDHDAFRVQFETGVPIAGGDD